MSNIVEAEENGDNWKAKTMVIGVALGALLGAAAAYMLIQNAEREQTRVKVSTGDGVKIGATVFGLLRQVSQIGG
jgi:hypothetical protein